MSVDERTIEALREALEDEYRARAIHARVIEKCGPVRPFVNVEAGENRHVGGLLGLFERCGVALLGDHWSDRVTIPSTLLEACRQAVDAEIENQAMYARLIARVDEPAARAVMPRLQHVSQEQHLPAFQR